MGGRFEGLEFYVEVEFYTLLIEFEEDIACMLVLLKWGRFEGLEFYEELEFYTMLSKLYSKNMSEELCY